MATQHGERRTLTVLFSDLSGFTTLSERMDPEDVRDIIDAIFQRFRAIIEREGGAVDKFIGDAVMAVFGAPAAHDDDPVRAIRAALAMQREVVAFNGERGLKLAARVGVNTGEALWGSFAGDRPTAMGDAVNVAQKLESSAKVGTVLVSETTKAAAEGRFRFEGLPAVAVKGRKEPVMPFVVSEVQA
jgi:class 3 adenylate cyclase